jgi:hypothetical protein
MFNLLLILLLILFILYLILNNKENFNENNKENFNENNKENFNENNKEILNENNKEILNENNKEICCLYAYYEKNDMYRENFEYFLQNAIYDEVDYYLIINGACSVNIPERKNITVLNRENKGFDFGAWSHGLTKLTKQYDYYTFLNTSVKGPYLYNKCEKWYDAFLRLFNKDIKLVGTTVNIYNHDYIYGGGGKDLVKIFDKKQPFTHVQSMFFIIDKEYLNYLNSINFFNEEKINEITDMYDIIANYELGLSQHAIKKGWNINCILQPYRNQDFRTLSNDFFSEGDIYHSGKYFGKSIDPYDVIFWKINRSI